jgi:hypothetical protein
MDIYCSNSNSTSKVSCLSALNAQVCACVLLISYFSPRIERNFLVGEGENKERNFLIPVLLVLQQLRHRAIEK